MARRSPSVRAALFHLESEKSALPELRAAAEARGWQVTMVEGVARKADLRARLERILEAARRREFDALLVPRLDHCGRSMLDAQAHLQELLSCSVRLVVTSQAIELGGGGAASRHQLAALAAAADLERAMVEKRNRGVARARRAGRGGPQPVPRPPAAKVRALRAAGRTWAEIVDQLGCSEWAARTVLRPDLLKSQRRKRQR